MKRFEPMFGSGIFKGLGITLRHLAETYWEDLRGWGRRYFRPEGIAARRSKDARGIFTIQYPEEKLPVPEAFRMFPFLIYTGEGEARQVLCKACGMCARICPPQCIWIVRGRDAVSGKPVPRPEEFIVEIDHCMNCGLCAEVCPAGAIRMDRGYELASPNRTGHRYNLDKLLKPESYHAAIHPDAFARERTARALRGARRTEES